MSSSRYKRPYTGHGAEPHLFADHQNCLKCGKWECAPEADDCGVSDAEYDGRIKEKADCDHLIGYGSDSDGGPLHESSRKKMADACFRGKQFWLKANLGTRAAMAHVATLDTPEKALADDFDLFVYCPHCGENL